MPLRSFEELLGRVKSTRRRTVALIEADDAHALEAIIAARDIVDAVLVGDKERICAALQELGENPSNYEIEQVTPGVHPAIAAAQLIHEGRAHFLMKGNIMTGPLLKGILARESNLRTGRLMSHLMIVELPGYPKLLAISDGGMCVNPDLDQKRQIVENAVGFLHGVGYERPAIAALCAIETVNPKMVETVDSSELHRMSLDGTITGCYVEGPISYDLAMVPGMGKIKGYHTDYAGEFDMLLAPQIVVANSLCKCMVYTCGGKNAGLILGCKVPVVLSSRGASAQEKYYSLALGAGVCG